MPITFETNEQTTVLRFSERCTLEDVQEILPDLAKSLEAAPDLEFSTADAESIDTPALQLALSAAASSRKLLTPEDPFIEKALKRWGLPALPNT